jgi:hypothetical protein
MHNFYQTNQEDRLLCEKLFTTCIAPWDMEVLARMRALHGAFVRADDHSIK